jgi:hypothetical protein
MISRVKTKPSRPWTEDDNFSDSQHGPNGEIRFTVRKPLEILEMEFDPTDAILENGYLEKGCPSVWCGIGGLGKSRLVLQFAIKSTLGQPFIGWKTQGEKLRWLLLQTENGNKRLQADLAAMMANLTSMERQIVNDAITIHTLENEDDGFMYLSNTKVLAAIQSLISSVKPNIVVFDPLRDFAAGELNSDADMAGTLSIIARLTRNGDQKRIPFIIHHAGTGKIGIAKAIGFERSGFGRNSKVLLGWTRSQINLAPYDPTSNEVLIVSSGKCNNAAEFEPFAIRLDTDTMTYYRDDDVDIETWKESMGIRLGKSPKATVATVVKIVEKFGLKGVRKATVAKAIIEEGVGRSYAYELIEKAEAKRAIVRRKDDDLYVVPQPPKNPGQK